MNPYLVTPHRVDPFWFLGFCKNLRHLRHLRDI